MTEIVRIMFFRPALDVNFLIKLGVFYASAKDIIGSPELNADQTVMFLFSTLFKTQLDIQEKKPSGLLIAIRPTNQYNQHKSHGFYQL